MDDTLLNIIKMKTVTLERIIKDGIRFLSEFFPLKTHLYFPLLYASFAWAIRREKEWKEKIFSWKVWLEPGIVKEKPDEFILNFFKRHHAMNRAYQSEIKERDLEVLRKAFSSLYPILGLEDPFLSALFHQELESGNFRKIVKEFEKKVSQAKTDIEAAESEPRLIKGLKTFAEEMASLNLDLISQTEIQKMVEAAVKGKIKEKNE